MLFNEGRCKIAITAVEASFNRETYITCKTYERNLKSDFALLYTLENFTVLENSNDESLLAHLPEDEREWVASERYDRDR